MAFFLFMISTLIFSTSHGLNITVPLIHRDSVYSPLYNASETIEDRAQRVTKASRARHDYLSSILFSDDVRPQAKLVTAMKTNTFYLNFSTGEPPLPQLALMDTGSAFLWVKCKPCQHEWECSHGPGDLAIYDLTNSETSFELPCLKDCDQCSGWLWRRRCKFTVTYYDGRVSEGIYVTDQLTFLPSSDYKAKVTVRNILFGCSSYFTARDEELDNHFNGVIGLGPYSDSEIELGYPNLISVSGSKFSYCTGRLHDRSYPYNQASFGGNAVLIGRSTPVNIDTGNYYVNLVNMSFAEQILKNIDPQVFQTMSEKNGILIDSGSELSYLPSKALDVVIAEVKKAAAIQGMKEVYTKFGSKLWAYQLCYKGTVDKEAFGFPPLGYHFEDGAQLLVDSVGLFVQVLDDAFCLGIHRTAYISIIGMTAQQGYNVWFDIKEKRMYFHSIHCGYLS